MQTLRANGERLTFQLATSEILQHASEVEKNAYALALGYINRRAGGGGGAHPGCVNMHDRMVRAHVHTAT